MIINVTKITDRALLDEAASFTSGKECGAIPLHKWYDAEHSPIRTQVFFVRMYAIPTFVSVHFVRHKVGVDHFVRSNREDRGGVTHADRGTPVNHAMFLNAQALIAMARKRLCGKASKETQKVFGLIKQQIELCDPDLALALVPECEYRGRCTEFKSCGRYKNKE